MRDYSNSFKIHGILIDYRLWSEALVIHIKIRRNDNSEGLLEESGVSRDTILQRFCDLHFICRRYFALSIIIFIVSIYQIKYFNSIN